MSSQTYKHIYCKNINKPEGCLFGKKCRYTHAIKRCTKYNTEQGCLYGNTCTFIHPKELCKNFWTKKGCKFGINCMYSHKKEINNVNGLSSEKLDSVKDENKLMHKKMLEEFNKMDIKEKMDMFCLNFNILEL